jgi:hypothetical protein
MDKKKETILKNYSILVMDFFVRLKIKAYFEVKICHMSHHKKEEHHIRPYKIAAQTAGLIVCIFILVFFAGKGIPEVLKMDENEWIPFLPFLAIPVAGYIVTWIKEFAGTMIMLTGGILLIAFFILKGDAGTGFIYGLPFILASIVFLTHIKKRNELKRKV